MNKGYEDIPVDAAPTKDYGMPLRFSGIAPLPEDLKQRVTAIAHGSENMDKDNRFQVDGVPMKAVGYVLSASPFREDNHGHGYIILPDREKSVYLGFEAEDGTVHDIRNCKELTPSRHVYGAVVKSPSNGALWLFVPENDAPARDLMTAEDVTSGRYAPRPVEGVTEYCRDHFFSPDHLESYADGEFNFSDEDRVTIMASSWHSGGDDAGLMAAFEAAISEAEARASAESPSP